MGLAQPTSSLDDPGSPQVHVSHYPRPLPLPASKEPTSRLEDNASHNGRSPVFKSICTYGLAAPIPEDICAPKDSHSELAPFTRSLGSSLAPQGPAEDHLTGSLMGKNNFPTARIGLLMREIESPNPTLRRRRSISDFVADVNNVPNQSRGIFRNRGRAQSEAVLGPLIIHEAPSGISLTLVQIRCFFFFFFFFFFFSFSFFLLHLHFAPGSSTLPPPPIYPTHTQATQTQPLFCPLSCFGVVIGSYFLHLLFRWRSMRELAGIYVCIRRTLSPARVELCSYPVSTKTPRADQPWPNNSLIQHKNEYITHSDRQKKHGGAEVDQTDCMGYLLPKIDCPDISRTLPISPKEFEPTTIDHSQEPPSTNTRTTIRLDPNPPAQNRRFDRWEMGDCVKYIQEHSQGPGWIERSPLNKCTIKGRHSGIPTVACLDFRSLLYPRRCYLKHRWPTISRLKRSEFKSCLAAASYCRAPHGVRLPGIQRIKGYSTSFSGEPGSGDVNLLDFSFCLSTFGSFLNGSGSTNGDEIESGQGPGSELLQGLGMDHELLRFIDSTEPGLNIFAPQLQYHDGADLPVQQPPHAPVPPVPLSVNLQFDVRGSEENTTVPALETPAPWSHHGGASNSAVQPSNTPLPENSQCDTRGPDWYDGFATGCLVTRGSGGAINRPQPCTTEWNKGFFYGFMLASRTLGQPSGSQPQPNLNGCSTAAAPTPTVVPNADVESSRTTTGLDYPTATPPTRSTLQSSIAHAVDDQPQAQPGLSNTQTIARRDTSNGVQITTTSTSQELASRLNDASTSSHIGPIRTGSNRNIYKCDTCKRGFPQRQRLDNHVKRDHLGRPNSK
ncbi:hypothetical protein RSOLAG22IIIB_05173 [Rhizoctonia solani]|uniref:C2H2-type domain-containing protein n=1 Tax=Rhizoctonia solani TaxID=456999 RepID=A0A0K6G491_9AGAM|nr:hypothetical protein RSOLAG22IIIB_05173 [Rhizoctonia solani]